MQRESLRQTHPPGDGDGCPGSATTDTLLPCGWNKTPERDPSHAAATSINALFVAVCCVEPPPLLRTCSFRSCCRDPRSCSRLSGGSGRNRTPKAEDEKNAVFNRQHERDQMRDVTSLPLQQVPQCRSNQPSIFKIWCRVHLKRLRDRSSKVGLQKAEEY